ncbi:hypothetical protein ABZV14_35870 [Streptosporangium canum]|uniref:hypothetical protein n=1 Tax=Streptosporangium canum TaxID=324952 RepID=UPI0033A4889F
MNPVFPLATLRRHHQPLPSPNRDHLFDSLTPCSPHQTRYRAAAYGNADDRHPEFDVVPPLTPD